jgi:hypothetical protein
VAVVINSAEFEAMARGSDRREFKAFACSSRLLQMQRKGKSAAQERFLTKAGRTGQSQHGSSSLEVWIENDFRYGKQSPRLQHLKNLSQRGLALRDLTQDSHENGEIKLAEVQFAVSQLYFMEADIVQTCLPCLFPGPGEHTGLNINGDDLTLGPNLFSYWNCEPAGSATNIEHPHARLQSQMFNDHARSIAP